MEIAQQIVIVVSHTTLFSIKKFLIESTLRIFTDITTFRTKEDVLFSRSSISSSNAKFQRSNIFLKRVVLKFSRKFPEKKENNLILIQLFLQLHITTTRLYQICCINAEIEAIKQQVIYNKKYDFIQPLNSSFSAIRTLR